MPANREDGHHQWSRILCQVRQVRQVRQVWLSTPLYGALAWTVCPEPPSRHVDEHVRAGDAVRQKRLRYCHVNEQVAACSSSRIARVLLMSARRLRLVQD